MSVGRLVALFFAAGMPGGLGAVLVAFWLRGIGAGALTVRDTWIWPVVGALLVLESVCAVLLATGHV